MSNTVNDLLRRIRALESGTGIGAGGTFSTGSSGTGGSGGSTVAAIPNPVIITDGTATDGKFEVLVSPATTFAGIYGNSADTTPLAQLYEKDTTDGASAVAGFQVTNSYTQTLAPTALPQGTPLLIKNDSVLSDTDSGFGPTAATSLYGPRALVNLEGTTQLAADQNTFAFTPIAFGDMMTEQNQVGANRTMVPGWRYMVASTTIADTNTLTLARNDIEHGRAGFVDSQTFFTVNSGILDGTTNSYNIISFLSMPFTQGNSHIATRMGVKINDMNQYLDTPGTVLSAIKSPGGVPSDAGLGVIDTQYGIYIDSLTQATTNIGFYNKASTVLAKSGGTQLLVTDGTAAHGAIDISVDQILGSGIQAIAFFASSSSLTNPSINLSMTNGANPTLQLGPGTGAADWTLTRTATSTATITGQVSFVDGTAAHGETLIQTTAFGSGVAVYGNSTDTQAAAEFNDLSGTPQLAFGPGGSSATDWKLARSGTAQATITGASGSQLIIGDGTAAHGGFLFSATTFIGAPFEKFQVLNSTTDANGTVEIQNANGAGQIGLGPGGATGVRVTITESSANVMKLTASSGVTTSAGLTVGGNLILNRVTKTAGYTTLASDCVVECTANTFTITMCATNTAGQIQIISNSGAGTITVAANSGKTLNGPTSVATKTAQRYVGDGSGNWAAA